MRTTQVVVLRVLSALAASVLVSGAVAAPAAASHPEIAQPFSAEVRSACTVAWTQGHLSWKAWHPPDRPGVNVTGEVGDRPIPNCNELISITFAEFRAFIGRTQVDREVVTVGEENPTEFRFTLTAGTSTGSPVIDRVVIRVCRGFPPDLPAICSPEQTRFPPR